MADTCQSISPQWFAIHTHPRQEFRADSNLRAWNVETFFPKMSQGKYGAKARGKQPVLKPLFPRYIFARFKIEDLLHKVRFTRGICGVVSFGGKPTPVNCEIISMIRSRMDEDGAVALYDDIEPGSMVLVTEGPFKGFSALFQRKLKGTTRLMLLLQTVSYQARVVVEREQVSKLN